MLQARLLAASVVCVSIGCLASAQDLGVFLSPPPPPGAWARYRIETRDPAAPPEAPAKVKVLSLAVTAAASPLPAGRVWVEASPMDLAGDEDGTLRLLLGASLPPGEEADPLLQATAVQFKPPHGEAYCLAASALGFFQGQLGGVKVTRTREPLPPETLPAGDGPEVLCARERVHTSAEGQILFKRRSYSEEGTRWTSATTPFRLVRAEFRRTETREGKPPRVRDVSIRLEAASPEGAATAFPKPPARTRGLLSLLFR